MTLRKDAECHISACLLVDLVEGRVHKTIGSEAFPTHTHIIIFERFT